MLKEMEVIMLQRVEPFAETMFLMMVADNAVADTEHRAIRAAIRELTDNQLSREAVDALLERFETSLATEGTESRLAQIGVRLSADREDRETAFALAAALALADEQVDAAENRALSWAREYFGISERRAAQILGSTD